MAVRSLGLVVLVVVVALVLVPFPDVDAWTTDLGPAGVMGGGNFEALDTQGFQFPILDDYGARMLRMNLYPGSYFSDATYTVLADEHDAFMNVSWTYGITPMILFEYYAGYSNPIGNYTKWHAIGRGFAQRYAPNVGTYWASRGITDFGLEVYSAFNEPEGSALDKVAYHDALEGLADGVHSVDPSLRVNPGGFKYANSRSDYTLGGFGTAVVDLWNAGKLDGVDLHTYYDYVYAPMEHTYHFSANSNFQSVKRTLNITRDINFYSTEFNYKAYNGAWSSAVKGLVNQTYAAKQLLAGIWDHLGAVKNDGRTSATGLAFVWNLFNTEAADPADGLAASDGPPFEPSPRAATLRMVLNLTAGMAFSTLDPLDTGTYTLIRADDGTKMWVFQNRAKWTTIAGTSFMVREIPSGAVRLEVYGWEGLRADCALGDGVSEFNVTDLEPEETYMFIARPSSSSAAGREGGSAPAVWALVAAFVSTNVLARMME